MPGGDLIECVNRHSDVDRLTLVGRSPTVRGEILIHHQLSDVVKGLHHLHSRNIIHGDLKGVRAPSKPRVAIVLIPNQPNILVDDTGHARITDFGFSTITHSLDAVTSASPDHGHSGRWTAPEVLDGGKSSKKADIFSFAMVMIEVWCAWPTVHRALANSYFPSIQIYTGAVPFESNPTTVAIVAIMAGRRPLRPTHATLTDDLWGLTNRCWDQEPHLRPETTELLRILCNPSVCYLHYPMCVC